MAKWLRNRRTGALRADLGHGLELRVWHEGLERLPSGAPTYSVLVFGQRLVDRSSDAEGGKARAETVARSWLSEAQIKLMG